MQAGDESVHTVNAAAVVLAAAARSSTGLQRNHHQHLQLHDHASAVTKKRWWSWLTKPNLACFRPHVGHPRRIANAGDTSPQPATTHTTASAAAYVHHPPPVHPVFAFVAPPSSPASSLFTSGSPSPAILLNASSTSSSGMFAVGPYAYGPQQLVSPPVLYSAFTTEASTAPRTPPATTSPSSPEVPFARFLSSSPSSSMAFGEAGLFHVYQLQPGNPIPLDSSSPQLFRKKLHRRNEGSLLDGHIPMATGGGELDLDIVSGTRDECHGGGVMDQDDDEVPKSGEFVFGNADNGGAAPAKDTDGDDRKSWQFFPMAEQGHDLTTQPLNFRNVQQSCSDLVCYQLPVESRVDMCCQVSLSLSAQHGNDPDRAMTSIVLVARSSLVFLPQKNVVEENNTLFTSPSCQPAVSL